MEAEVEAMQEEWQKRAAERAACGGGAVAATCHLSQPNSAVIHLGTWLKPPQHVQSQEDHASQQLTTGDPFLCGGCGFVMDLETAKCIISKARAGNTGSADSSSGDGMVIKEWPCPLCGGNNTIDAIPEELPCSKTDQDQEYLEAPAIVTVPNVAARETVCFVVDCSGSMGVTSEVVGLSADSALRQASAVIQPGTGDARDQRLPGERPGISYVSRMQCVKHALLAQLAELSPERRSISEAGLQASEQVEVVEPVLVSADLIAFNNLVRLLGDGSADEAIIEGDRLHDRGAITFAAKTFASGSGGGATCNSCDNATQRESDLEALASCVDQLEEGGPTALGPALLAALEVVKVRSGTQGGGRVVLLTDGLANVGLGNLEEGLPSVAGAFYDSIADQALVNGVAVSVVAVEGDDAYSDGGSRVGLSSLGRICDKTGGTVELVTALGLASSILGQKELSLATRATVTVLVGYQGGVSAGEDASEKARILRIERQLGNVTASTDVEFDYDIFKETNCDLGAGSGGGPGETGPVMIQVQFRFVLPNGDKRLRVRTIYQPTTSDRSNAEKDIGKSRASSVVLRNTGNFTSYVAPRWNPFIQFRIPLFWFPSLSLKTKTKTNQQTNKQRTRAV